MTERKQEFDPRNWEVQAESASELIRQIVNVAKHEINSGSLLETDKQELVRAVRLLQTSFDQINEFYFAPMQEKHQANATHGYMMLQDLMLGALLVGAQAMKSDSLKAHFMTPIINGGSKGGKKSGEARRAKAEESWKPIAERLIHEAYKTDPAAGKKKLALKSLAKWPPRICQSSEVD